jgi:hypothetical protein
LSLVGQLDAELLAGALIAAARASPTERERWRAAGELAFRKGAGEAPKAGEARSDQQSGQKAAGDDAAPRG